MPGNINQNLNSINLNDHQRANKFQGNSSPNHKGGSLYSLLTKRKKQFLGMIKSNVDAYTLPHILSNTQKQKHKQKNELLKVEPITYLMG